MVLALVAANENPAAAVSAGIFTAKFDVGRTGQNLNETVLTPSNVNAANFGRLGAFAVDGQVYAQPLYKAGVVINGTSHNVVFIATEHDSLYAFDADNLSAAPLWHVSFLQNGARPVYPSDIAGDMIIGPELGTTSTPVIDPITNTIYVMSYSNENGAFFYRLHAIDLSTGSEKLGGSVAIRGSMPGTGSSSVNGTVFFDPQWEHQRPALLLSGGKIFIAFGAHPDIDPFHGWIFAYDAVTLQQKGIFNSTPNDGEGGFWFAGGPATDATGSIYMSSGNAPYDPSKKSFGDTVLKLSFTNGGIANILDYFTPFDALTLQNEDRDMAPGGVTLLPDQGGAHPHLMMAGGKGGKSYLIDRDAMSGFHPGADQVVQSFDLGLCSRFTNAGQPCPPYIGLFTGASYFNRKVYLGASTDLLRAYDLVNGQLTLSSTSAMNFNYPGTSAQISANGNQNGIVWAIENAHARNGPGPGSNTAILHAFDASNLKSELYNSLWAGARDIGGNAIKFSMPSIVNGKVFVGTETGVDVYGLFSGNPMPSPVWFGPIDSTICSRATWTSSWSAPMP